MAKSNDPLLHLEMYASWLANHTTSYANTLVVPSGACIIVIRNAQS